MGTQIPQLFTLSCCVLALSGCPDPVPGEPGDYLGRCIVPAFQGDSKICFEVRDSEVSESEAKGACKDLYGSGDPGNWKARGADADKYFDGCPKPDLFGDSSRRLYGRCDGFIYQERGGDKAFYAHGYFYGPYDESGNSQSWGCESFDEGVYYPAMEMPGDQATIER